MTQLLVSVRSAIEAIAAMEGMADIVDVKEPGRGSLGCASPEVIAQVALAVRSQHNSTPPLSLALGELAEWRTTDRTLLRDSITIAQPQFLKLGLSGAARQQRPEAWIAEWQAVRDSISGPHDWVAVAYADHEIADSPSVEKVLNAAIETRCGILLIDTYAKNGTSLLDHLTLKQLHSIRQETHRGGLRLALAGRVTLSNLSLLHSVAADIIAVRGAVCDNGERISSISGKLVSGFRTAVHSKQG